MKSRSSSTHEPICRPRDILNDSDADPIRHTSARGQSMNRTLSHPGAERNSGAKLVPEFNDGNGQPLSLGITMMPAEPIDSHSRRKRAGGLRPVVMAIFAIALLFLGSRQGVWAEDHTVHVYIGYSSAQSGGTAQGISIVFPMYNMYPYPQYEAGDFYMVRTWDKCSQKTGFNENLDYAGEVIVYPGSSISYADLAQTAATEFAQGGLLPSPYQMLATGGMIDAKFPFNCNGPLPPLPKPPIVPTAKPTPPPTCPSGSGAASTGSYIDNATLNYIHDAIDYQIDRASSKGCTSCGASGQAEPRLPTLMLTRYHRYKDMDLHGSFGPGVFSSYDLMLNLDATSFLIEYFNPENPTPLDLTPGATTGVFNDKTFQGVNNISLYDSSSTLTWTMSAAHKAILTNWDGTTATFEIIQTETGTSTNYSGRLIAQTDRNGNATTISYLYPAASSVATLGYDRGRLWEMANVTDAYGQTMTFTYAWADGQWVISAVALPNGTSLAYQYDTDRLVGVNRISYPDGTVSTFRTTSDVTNQIQQVIIDDAGASTTHRRKTVSFSFGSFLNSGTTVPVAQPPNLVRKVVNGLGEISYENWLATSPDGTLMTTTFYEGGGDQTGKVTAYTTQDGNPVSTQIATAFTLANDPSTYAWQTLESYSTDAQERIGKSTDALSRPTSFTRDASGAITSTTEYLADGVTIFSQSTTTYNGFEEPLIVTDSLGRITHYAYDGSGNLLTKISAFGTPDQAQWSWTYNARGQPLSATDANGNATMYVYDETPIDPAYKHLIAIVEPADAPGGAHATSLFAFDSAGRLATSTDAGGRIATYTYDARSRIPMEQQLV
jgi:YD repeat-containing protein